MGQRDLKGAPSNTSPGGVTTDDAPEPGVDLFGLALNGAAEKISKQSSTSGDPIEDDIMALEEFVRSASAASEADGL